MKVCGHGDNELFHDPTAVMEFWWGEAADEPAHADNGALLLARTLAPPKDQNGPMTDPIKRLKTRDASSISSPPGEILNHRIFP